MPHSIHLLTSALVPIRPLDDVTLLGPPGVQVEVADASGRVYARGVFGPSGEWRVTVGGSLGTHIARGTGAGELQFKVTARSTIRDDGGRFERLFDQLDRTLRCYNPNGYDTLQYHGRTYHCYVHWILDHVHTAKGMQYVVADRDDDGRPIDPTASFADLWAENQKPDGMVWSNAFDDRSPDYFHSAYGPYGFSKIDGGLNFNRQPVENHNEYNYTETVYLAWKAHGNDDWLRGKIESVLAALRYSITDPLRYSARFGLLKRGYCIDSWDFQVDDQYTVKFYLATAQQISPDTKFGVFFGDNHGYAMACDMAAEMLRHLGRSADADTLSARARDIRQRLDDLTWNGRFYTHRIEEDPTVIRDLGVDETSQIAMSNGYALNRGISHHQAVAICRTYQQLRVSGAPESPGEWYAIYPPFARGFGHDSTRWQYMNGGVHGHAAGELARGAFEHGFEAYAVDILLRISTLADKHPKGIVAFAWTGGWDPAPPPPTPSDFAPVDLHAVANMSLASDGPPPPPTPAATSPDPRHARPEGPPPRWMLGDAGNDLRSLPTGRQTFAGIPWEIPDPATNAGRSVVAVAVDRPELPTQVIIPVRRSAGALYLLHTVGGLGASGIAAAATLVYDDGTTDRRLLQRDKHIAGWWYPTLKGEQDGATGVGGGVAWTGSNRHTSGVGLCWCVLPADAGKVLQEVRIEAIAEGPGRAGRAAGPIYTLAALTTAPAMPYRRAPLVSHGGPDNWSGGTCMYALMQGLAGATDLATRFQRVRLSPRWAVTGTRHVHAVVKYGVSDGYIAYDYTDTGNALHLRLTGSGHHADLRLLLPPGRTPSHATLDGQPVPFTTETLESSTYAVLPVPLPVPVRSVEVQYR